MQFMITFNHIDGVWDRLSEEERSSHEKWLLNFMEELKEQKQTSLVFFNSPDQRRTVRKQLNGDLEVLDGPAIPGAEQVGGYFLIDADTEDEAVEWAKKGRWLEGSNEIRQMFGAWIIGLAS